VSLPVTDNLLSLQVLFFLELWNGLAARPQHGKVGTGNAFAGISEPGSDRRPLKRSWKSA
jgi:hypothetical protein